MKTNIDCILLVDDSLSSNMFNRKLLQLTGVAKHVFEAHNGIEALDFIKGNGKFSSIDNKPTPDIILLDINMPKMDGFEFLEEYSKLPEEEKTSIIILVTTSNWEKDRVRAKQTGLVRRFLEKPLQKNDMIKLKNDYISHALDDTLI